MEKVTKQKGTSFVVEIIKKEDDSRIYVVRSLQGAPIRVLESPEDIVTFFNEYQF